jgi:hypothetical protein
MELKEIMMPCTYYCFFVKPTINEEAINLKEQYNLE